MPLTEKAIQALRPTDRLYRVADAAGLCLEVSTTGKKLWRLRYRHLGKAKMLALGAYPAVTLAQARQAAAKARLQVADGTDPSAQRVQARRQAQAQAQQALETFEYVALQWQAQAHPKLAPATRAKHVMFFTNDVFPYIGQTPIAAITAQDVLQVLQRIVAREAFDVAKRTHNLIGRVFRYAVVHGIAARNPAADIALTDLLHHRPCTQHHASVTDPKDVAALLRACDNYMGAVPTRCALKLAALLFVRPGELRHAEWVEFDFDKAEWRIPAHKMKMGEQHIVPLSRQALAMLEELRAWHVQQPKQSPYLFPSARTATRPMSENTVTAALARIGYKGEQSGHGFRSLASTLLHELGYPHEHIEAQLAHGERGVSASYNFAKYLPQRRQMMQQWADHLDALRKGAKVVPIFQQQA